MNNQKPPMFIHTHGLNKLDKVEQYQESLVKNEENKIDIQKQIQHFQNLSLCAILSSDIFADKIVLTGGSVLNLVYNVHNRVSVDLDLSLESPILPHEYVRLETELDHNFEEAFSKENYKVLNSRLEIRSLNLHNKFSSENLFDPKEILYKYAFQLMDLNEYKEICNHPGSTKEQKEVRCRDNIIALPNKKKFFEIDFKWEGPILEKQEYEINNYTLKVPSPYILLCKKMIGILAHSPNIGDTPEKFKRARAQDFFDIHSLIASQMIHLQDLLQPNNLKIFQTMLTEKNIETSSLKDLKKHREFHQNNFADSVRNMSLFLLGNFKYYFDFIIHLIDYMYPFLTTLKSVQSTHN
ncbi:nucleotidyl transferase AbiEii/AbiGii toxin family protein [Bacillus thuringiensis]|nr:nucleotidyl transferase AbiEii/AbiGii toxin family protein [Bacillus thuringiensis]